MYYRKYVGLPGNSLQIPMDLWFTGGVIGTEGNMSTTNQV